MSSIKKSIFWSAVEQLGPKMAQMAIGVFLARLLEPSAYGLVGMLTLFIATAQVFSDSGLSSSLIQSASISADDETSVCAMNLAAGLTMAGLLCLVSPLVAEFYHQPLLLPMLCVQSLTVVFASLCMVQSALLTRKMQFRKTASIKTASSLTSGLVGIGLAWSGFGVWSLVLAVVAESFTRFVLLTFYGGWRPRGRVRFQCIRSMWSFSSYLLYSSLIGIVMQNLMSVIIGKVYSPASLGLYDRANNLRMLPVGMISGVVTRVAFPLLSRLQGESDRFLLAIRGMIRSTLFLSAACLTMLALIADPLVPILLTERWRAAVPLLRILCYAGFFFPISSLLLIALRAQGKSKLTFRLECVKLVIGLVTAIVVFPYGVSALAWSVVALTLIAFFLNAHYSGGSFGYKWQMQVEDILPSFLVCGIAATVSLLLGQLTTAPPVTEAIFKLSAFVAVSGFLIFEFRKSYFADIWKQVSSAFERLSPKKMPV